MKPLLFIFALVALAAGGQNLTLSDGAHVGASRPAAASSGTSFTDNFTRADANPMSNPGSGGTWTSGPGTGTDCEIASNLLDGTSGYCVAMVATPDFADNQKATVTIATSNAYNFLCAAVRIQSGSDASGYYAVLDDTTHVIIYRIDDTGSLAFVALGATITVDSTGVGDTLGISASGTTIEAFRNGVSIGTRTDSTYSTGQPGVLLLNERRLSSFTGEDL